MCFFVSFIFVPFFQIPVIVETLCLIIVAAAFAMSGCWSSRVSFPSSHKESAETVIVDLRLKLVPHPPDGLYAVALLPHFGAKFFDVGVDGAGVTEIVVVPDVIQDLFTGKGYALV